MHLSIWALWYRAERVYEQARGTKECCTWPCVLPHPIARIQQFWCIQFYWGEAGGDQLCIHKFRVFCDNGWSRWCQGCFHRAWSPEWLLWKADWNSTLLCRWLWLPCLWEGWLVKKSKGGVSISREVSGWWVARSEINKDMETPGWSEPFHHRFSSPLEQGK